MGNEKGSGLETSRKAAMRRMFKVNIISACVALVVSFVMTRMFVTPGTAEFNAPLTFFVLAAVWIVASMIGHRHGGTLTSIVGSAFFVFWMIYFRVVFPLEIEGVFRMKGWLSYGALGSYLWMLVGLIFCSPSWFKNWFLSEEEFPIHAEKWREISAILGNTLIGLALSIGYLQDKVPSMVYFFASFILIGLASIPYLSKWMKFLQLVGYLPGIFLGIRMGSLGPLLALVIFGIFMLVESVRKKPDWDTYYGSNTWKSENGNTYGFQKEYSNFHESQEEYGDFHGSQESYSDSRSGASYGIPKEIEWALGIFGLSTETMPSKKELKILYHKRAKAVHPDEGGSEDKMKDLNQAFEILKRYVK